MKILITFMTAESNTFGGVERSIFSLIDGLSKNGAQVYVYTANRKEKLNNFFYSKYLISEIPTNINIIDETVLNNIKKYSNEITNEINKIIEDIGIDYLLSVDQLWGITTGLDNLDHIICKKGIVFHMNFQEDLINRALSIGYNNYFAVSDEIKSKINKQNKIIHLLPNSFVKEDFNTDDLNLDDYIFCNSRIADGKGIEFLVPAFAKYSQIYQSTKLLLCGGYFHFGNRNKTLRKILQQVKDYKLMDKVIILKKLGWHEIPQITKNAKMIILPTQYESFGIAALEAMASGKFLIASRVGNLPALINAGGILVDYGNVDQIYQAMLLYDNEGVRKKTTKNAVLQSSRYTSVEIAKNFIEIIGGDINA